MERNLNKWGMLNKSSQVIYWATSSTEPCLRHWDTKTSQNICTVKERLRKYNVLQAQSEVEVQQGDI